MNKKILLSLVLLVTIILPTFAKSSSKKDSQKETSLVTREMLVFKTATFTKNTAGESSRGSFALGKYEITYKLWYDVYTWALGNGYTFAHPGKQGSRGEEGAEPSSDENQYQPVTNISWNDAIVWCNAYSEISEKEPAYVGSTFNTNICRDSTHQILNYIYVNKSANGYRLPTEAEWEYAARGGDDFSGEVLLYCNDNSSDIIDIPIWNGENSRGLTRAVIIDDEIVKRNVDLYYMNGNVSEFCYVQSSDEDTVPYKGGNIGSYRRSCTISDRGTMYANRFSDEVGFRVAVSTEPSTIKSIAYTDVVHSFETVKSQMMDIQITSGKTESIRVPQFNIGKCEVTYALWYKVYKWALQNGYNFVNEGSQGNQGEKGTEPSNDEDQYKPVVNISWRDAIIWCNAYSEYNGRNPVYYKDSFFEEVYRDSSESIEDTLYRNDNVLGYRLPSPFMWKYAAQGGNNADTVNWNYKYSGSDTLDSVGWNRENSSGVTQVAQKLPNSLGLYDMSGNVNEWCDEPGTTTQSYAGGSYSEYQSYCAVSHLRKTDRLYYFYSNIGFRVICSNSAEVIAKVDYSKVANSFVTVDSNIVLTAPTSSRNSFFSEENLPGVFGKLQSGTCEVTNDLWYTVYTWAIKSGYVFENKSIKTILNKSKKYEPVASISWRDAIVWCNAYSQYYGRSPVYYSDNSFTKVCRDSTQEIEDGLFRKEKVTGFRLPTQEEWEYIARGADANNSVIWNYNYSGSDTFKFVGWGSRNSKSLSKVAQKLPNSLGIYDMSGNVSEWCDSFIDNRYVVTCGGDYTSYESSCKVTSRDSRKYPNSTSYKIGFRVVCNAE